MALKAVFKSGPSEIIVSGKVASFKNKPIEMVLVDDSKNGESIGVTVIFQRKKENNAEPYIQKEVIEGLVIFNLVNFDHTTSFAGTVDPELIAKTRGTGRDNKKMAVDLYVNFTYIQPNKDVNFSIEYTVYGMIQ